MLGFCADYGVESLMTEAAESTIILCSSNNHSFVFGRLLPCQVLTVPITAGLTVLTDCLADCTACKTAMVHFDDLMKSMLHYIITLGHDMNCKCVFSEAHSEAVCFCLPVGAKYSDPGHLQRACPKVKRHAETSDARSSGIRARRLCL